MISVALKCIAKFMAKPAFAHIHGNGGSINNFIIRFLISQKNTKCIIADSRAQGKSKDDGDSLSYEMMADDYGALLSALKVDSAFVIGWSDVHRRIVASYPSS